MDILAHFLLVYLLFIRHPDVLILAIIGILPDVFSLSIHCIKTIFFKIKKQKTKKVSKYSLFLYRFNHSLVIFTLFFALIYLINKNLTIYTIPWLIHILLDIPTHSKSKNRAVIIREEKLEDFSTKIMWPLSDFSFDGVDWDRKYFFFKAYLIILILYAIAII